MKKVCAHLPCQLSKILANLVEAFVAINARNLLTFGLTYFVNDWLAKDGVLDVFNVLGGTFIAVTMLTVPLWILGKRLRSAVARNVALTKFMKD